MTPEETQVTNTMFVRGLQDTMKLTDLSAFFKEGRKLTPKAREALPSSAFVYPKEEKYPIHDLVHARNALSRVSTFGSSAEKTKVRGAVYSRYPALKKRHEEREGKKAASDFAERVKRAFTPSETPDLEASTSAEAATAGVRELLTSL